MIICNLSTYARMLWAIFKRDTKVYFRHWLRSFINYGIIYPTLWSISFGLLLPYYGLGHQDALMTTMMICGSFIWIVLPVTYHLNMDLMYEINNKGYIWYYLTFAPSTLLLVERLIFSTFISLVSAVPFFCMIKLILGNLFLSATLSVPLLLGIITSSGLFCGAFNIFTMTIVYNDIQMTNFFIRIVMPAVNFGCFLVPWYAMRSIHPLIGFLTLANPFTYITDGLRSSIVGNSLFIPASYCVGALTGFAMIFIILAAFFFKRKTDLL